MGKGGGGGEGRCGNKGRDEGGGSIGKVEGIWEGEDMEKDEGWWG